VGLLLVAQVLGILILLVSRLLNYIVAVYLILVGLIGIVSDQSRSIETESAPARAETESEAPEGRALVRRCRFEPAFDQREENLNRFWSRGGPRDGIAQQADSEASGAVPGPLPGQ
jgi:hypothetical protein